MAEPYESKDANDAYRAGVDVLGESDKAWLKSEEGGGPRTPNLRLVDADLNVHPWPKMGQDASIGLMGAIADLATRKSEADRVAVIATALTWSAAVLGRNRYVEVGDSVHHTRLNVVLVGASSRARKGTSLDPVRKIFDAAENYRLGSLTASASWPRLQTSHGPMSSGEGLVDAIRDKRDEDDEGGVDDKRLLCVEPEFGAVLRSGQRQGNTLSTVIRTAWDGLTISPLTKHAKVCATDPHICLLAHITRSELNELLTSSDAWNGFANRFLWLAVRRSAVVPFPLPMPADEVKLLAQELGSVVGRSHRSSGEAARVSMTSPARERWAEVYRELTSDHPGILGAVTSRAEAQTLRLAMTYALLDGSDSIELKHVDAAIALWRYAFDSAAYIFGTSELDPAAQRVIEALASGPASQTEMVDLFARNLSKKKLESVLFDLQERGRITLTVESTGGRPRKTWSLAH